MLNSTISGAVLNVLGKRYVARNRKERPLTFGERLRRLRRERRLTQAQLGEKIGNDGAYVSRLENDETKPGFDKLAALATALDTQVGVITGEQAEDVEAAIWASDLDDEAKRLLVRMYRELRPDGHR